MATQEVIAMGQGTSQNCDGHPGHSRPVTRLAPAPVTPPAVWSLAALSPAPAGLSGTGSFPSAQWKQSL